MITSSVICDVISLFATRISKKMTKIVNIDDKILISSDELRNFNEIFRKNVSYDNTKSHKKQCFILFLENAVPEKPQGGCQFEPPDFLRLNSY